jgi:hypothetical protein
MKHLSYICAVVVEITGRLVEAAILGFGPHAAANG